MCIGRMKYFHCSISYLRYWRKECGISYQNVRNRLHLVSQIFHSSIPIFTTFMNGPLITGVMWNVHYFIDNQYKNCDNRVPVLFEPKYVIYYRQVDENLQIT